MRKDERGEDSHELLRASGQHLGHGLTWALSVLLFMLFGNWVDSKLGTSPLIMLLGVFIGAGAGGYSLYYHIVIKSRNRENGVR